MDVYSNHGNNVLSGIYKKQVQKILYTLSKIYLAHQSYWQNIIMPILHRENGYVGLDNNTTELECKLGTSDFIDYNACQMTLLHQLWLVHGIYYLMDTVRFLMITLLSSSQI